MHDEVLAWVKLHGTDEPVAVLEIGGRNVNGTVRDCFPNADPYIGLDMQDGPGVDVIADATCWEPDREYDIVISTGMLEHLERWRDIIATAYRALRPGGRLILTCAGPGWQRHGANGEGLQPGEWYQNIEPADLWKCFDGWADAHVDMGGAYNADVRAEAWKR